MPLSMLHRRESTDKGRIPQGQGRPIQGVGHTLARSHDGCERGHKRRAGRGVQNEGLVRGRGHWS